jgi:hypothetical protein
MTAAQASKLPGQPSRFTILYRQANGLLPVGAVSCRLNPKSVWISRAGERLPAYVWAKRLGIAPDTLRMRLKRGWPVERALNPQLRPSSIQPPAR